MSHQCDKNIISKNNDDDDEASEDSADEALCEMLGIPSLKCMDEVDSEPLTQQQDNNIPAHQQSIDNLLSNMDRTYVQNLINQCSLYDEYRNKSICRFPAELAISGPLIRRLADELIWGGEKYNQINRSYETIRIWKKGTITERRVLTRIENISRYHDGWNQLCNGYVRFCISIALGEDMVLYKEKLNLKPAGGSGFAPHLDTPSLRASFSKDGPRTFVTVMIAIDDMTTDNGCLRLVPGQWDETTACTTIQPDADGNPDAEGRAGAIPTEIADNMQFEDVTCPGGTIVAFNGWIPHRSNPNKSIFPRRAIFLTYNPAKEGNFYDKYYSRMDELRTKFRNKIGLTQANTLHGIDQLELDALASIPLI